VLEGLGKPAIRRRVDHVGSAAEHGDGDALSGQRAAMGGGVDPQGQPADDRQARSARARANSKAVSVPG